VSSQTVELYVAIDPQLPRELKEPVVAWGDFVSSHPGVVIYEAEGVSQLSRLYVDLICGRPMPVQFVTRSLDDIAVVVAIALFMDRHLVLNPKVGGLVSAVEMVGALGAAGLAHVDRDLGRLFTFIEVYLFSEDKPAKKVMEQKLSSALQWVREYVLEDKLPSMPFEHSDPKVLDIGTNGFVLAEVEGTASMILGVVELFRQGHLRGVLFRGSSVLGFRKSLHLKIDFEEALGRLNKAEAVLGQTGEWRIIPGGLYLESPPGGTAIPREVLISALLRV
jgi:hypothetical protein